MQDTNTVTAWLVLCVIAFIILLISYLVKSKRLREIDKDKDLNKREAMLLFEQWKIAHEAAIREDAIKRSAAVHLGKITEHFIPFMSAFPYNTKDVRFVGSPIDLIIFDGHNEQKDEIDIIIVEVKTGKSKLSKPQQKIKDAVLNGRVRWLETGGDFGKEKNDKNLFN